MKIVYLHQYFTTPDGSGGTRSYEMARRWVEAGHEVHMVTSDRSANARHRGWRVEEIAGIKVHSLSVPYDNAMGFAARVRAFLSYAWSAGPHARALRGDVVFATSTPLTVILPALSATVGRRARIVFEVRDLWPEMPIATGDLRNPALKLAARALERLAYRRSARIVALSDGMADGVIARGTAPHKVTVATNACDVAEFSVGPAEIEAFRQRHPWLAGRALVTYAGTLGKINDVAFVVRLAAHLRTVAPQVAFAVFGDGRDRPAIAELAAELGVLDVNFHLLAPLPKREVPALLGATTVSLCVFGPVKEMEVNSANKFFDALASGTPVAINYGGWQAEIIRAHGVGVVLDRADEAAAAERLLALVRDEAALAAAGKAALHLAETRYARDHISDVVLDVVETVGADRQGRPSAR